LAPSDLGCFAILALRWASTSPPDVPRSAVVAGTTEAGEGKSAEVARRRSLGGASRRDEPTEAAEGGSRRNFIRRDSVGEDQLLFGSTRTAVPYAQISAQAVLMFRLSNRNPITALAPRWRACSTISVIASLRH
jgi:hypothetical protein